MTTGHLQFWVTNLKYKNMCWKFLKSKKNRSKGFVTQGMMNITREKLIDLSTSDFTDENGFFLRSGTGGIVKYCPIGNADAEFIIKTMPTSASFCDPTICRKVFRLVTSPDTELYAGWGI